MNLLVLAALGLLIVLVAAYFGREGFYSGSASDTEKPTIRDGFMVYVYDSGKAYSRTNNWVARVIQENTRATDVSGVGVFRINASSEIGVVYMDLKLPTYEILRPIFPNSMGIYLKGAKNSLLFNGYFGMDRITNEADAKKILNGLFVAKGDAEFASAMSQQLGLYVERRNDMPTVDALVESLYMKQTRAAITAAATPA
jgi:hypothetical protein